MDEKLWNKIDHAAVQERVARWLHQIEREPMCEGASASIKIEVANFDGSWDEESDLSEPSVHVTTDSVGVL